MLDPIKLTKQLISMPSITPADAGCQALLSQHLQKLGFTIESLSFGEVSNFWARRGKQGPLLAFVGHSDVVPTGPLEQWTSPPFQPEIRNGFLYGRGAADMKSNIAAMLVACERFIQQHPEHPGSIAWLITSDEEGPAINGTVKVIEHLLKRNEKIDWCIVGEPSSDQTLGDIIKIGRRGSLSGQLTIYGKQGHIAYPHLAENPIHKAMPALTELTQIIWDNGNDYFPPTSLQFSNIHAGTGAGNVIPGQLVLDFNFRYSPEVSAETLQEQFKGVLQRHKIQYDVAWRHSGLPFLTAKGELVEASCRAIEKIIGITPLLSTSGGTSDGRFIATTGSQVVELGVCNHTIHQIDECVAIADIEKLTLIYQNILEQLFL
jgi:succinyl-diaminopimelate desuccinylase